MITMHKFSLCKLSIDSIKATEHVSEYEATAQVLLARYMNGFLNMKRPSQRNLKFQIFHRKVTPSKTYLKFLPSLHLY
jgi:hypothetical protein